VRYRADDWLFSASEAEPQVLSLMSQRGNDYSIKLGDQATHGTVLRDGELLHVFATAPTTAAPTTQWRTPAKPKPKAAA
jgi:hypothetical protein